MVYVIVSLPFLLLLTFGIVTAARVDPPAIGFALVFVGFPAFMLWLATQKWDSQGWRMSSDIMRLLLWSFVMLTVYLMITPVIDPPVLAGESLDLFATTAVFFAQICSQ